MDVVYRCVQQVPGYFHKCFLPHPLKLQYATTHDDQVEAGHRGGGQPEGYPGSHVRGSSEM